MRKPSQDERRTIAADGTIIRVLVGSNLHGLQREGTDDRDEMAVCIEPPEHVLGLGNFEHYVFRTQPEGHPSGPGDLDLVVYSLRKYCRLALKGSPTVLLLLFVSGEPLLVQTALGAELQGMAPAFLSHRTARAFIGYLDSQRRGLEGAKHSPNRERERSETYGYDTKYAMHALRIGYQGQELLETGRISLPVPEPERSHLMDVRMGKVPLPKVIDELNELVAMLDDLASSSDLPLAPDYEAVDRFLVATYTKFWSERGLWSASDSF